MKRPYPFPATSGIEPTVGEMLCDQTMHMLLARDGLEIADLKAVIRRWQERQQQLIKAPVIA